MSCLAVSRPAARCLAASCFAGNPQDVAALFTGRRRVNLAVVRVAYVRRCQRGPPTNGETMSDIEALAGELDARARRIELIGDQLVHAAAVALWTSAAADAFRAQVARRRHDIADVAARLRSAAATARCFARDVEAEKARLRKLEEAALHGIAHGAAAAVHGGERVLSWTGL